MAEDKTAIEDLHTIKYELRSQTAIIVLVLLLNIINIGFGLMCLWEILKRD